MKGNARLKNKHEKKEVKFSGGVLFSVESAMAFCCFQIHTSKMNIFLEYKPKKLDSFIYALNMQKKKKHIT